MANPRFTEMYEKEALEIFQNAAHKVATWMWLAKSAQKANRMLARKDCRDLLNDLGDYRIALREIAEEAQRDSGLDQAPFLDMIDQIEQVRQQCAMLALSLVGQHTEELEQELRLERQRMADLMI